MAKRLAIPSKELQIAVVGPKNYLHLPRVQRLSFDTTRNSTDVDEIGNPRHVGTSSDLPETTVTFSAFDVGIKIFSVLTGTDWTNYPSAGVDISALGEADVILYVKDPAVSDYVKSGHGQRLQIREFTFTYNVDGESTEDYTLIGSKKRWFKYDVVVNRFTTGTTSFTLSNTPLQLKNGNYLLSVILDGQYLKEVTGTPGPGEYSVSGTTLTTGSARTSQVLAVYHANPAGNNWTDINDNTMPAVIRGQDVKVVISAQSIPRVQSVTINGNLRPENVRELGARAIVGYQRQVPTVEGTITVLDTDLELISLLTTGQLNPSGVVEFSTDEVECSTSGVPLKIELVDPCDTTEPLTVLKTIYIPQITIVGDSFTSNVNGNATQTFNFRSATAECIIYSGAMP